jgi:putative membrane protein
MIPSALLSAVHLLTLALGLGAVVARGRALRGPLDAGGLRQLFLADNLWGLAALLWLSTGLLRAFGGFEKGSAFYLHNRMFLLKMALFLGVFALELRPMVTFIRWRLALKRGLAIDS